MAQHDYSIANQTAPNTRTDLNNALAAIVSQNSGATAPSTTFANMIWYDTANNVLKMRNEADSAWVEILDIDQAGTNKGISGVSGTNGNLAKWDANGNLIDGGTKGWTVLETQSVSNSASLEFTAWNNTLYKDYELEFWGVYPSANNNQKLIFEISSDSGSTYPHGWKLHSSVETYMEQFGSDTPSVSGIRGANLVSTEGVNYGSDGYDLSTHGAPQFQADEPLRGRIRFNDMDSANPSMDCEMWYTDYNSGGTLLHVHHTTSGRLFDSGGDYGTNGGITNLRLKFRLTSNIYGKGRLKALADS